MLNRKTYKYLGHHYKFASIFCALPYKWDSESETLHVSQSKVKWLLFGINCIVSAVMTFNLYYCIVTGIVYETRDISNLAVDIMFAITWTSQFFFHLKLWINAPEQAELINHILSMDKHFTNKYCAPTAKEKYEEGTGEEKKIEKKAGKAKKEKEPTDGVDGNVFSSLYMMFVYASMTASMFIQHHDSPRYMFRYLPIAPEDRQAWMIYMWSTMEWFHVIKFCYVFNEAFYIMMIYPVCTNHWLYELSRPTPGKEEVRTINKPISRSAVIMNYKAIQVLNVHFNECCTRIIVPTFKCLNIGLHVMAIYVSITYYGKIPIGGFMIFPVGMLMWMVIEVNVYEPMGKTNELSGSYQVSWQTTLGSDAEKYFRSMFTLGIKVGNSYVIEKSTILTIWSTVFNFVINCVLL